jgi:arginine exporter protein ArgO
MSGILTFIVGLVSVLAGMLWLFPSLGPTIYLQTQKPADPSSRFLNVVLGHLLGLAAGFAGLFIFNAFNDPVALQAKELTWPRLGAAVFALALTLLLTLLFKAHHPPAGATTLLTALGSIQTAQDAINLMIGVLIVAVAGELVRKTRTNTLTTLTVAPKVPPKEGKM